MSDKKSKADEKKRKADEVVDTDEMMGETHRLRSMMMILLVAVIATIGLRYLVAGRAD